MLSHNIHTTGQLLRLKMFREDHGSWMTMFFSTILFLFIFSHIYNLFLIMAGNMRWVTEFLFVSFALEYILLETFNIMLLYSEQELNKI